LIATTRTSHLALPVIACRPLAEVPASTCAAVSVVTVAGASLSEPRAMAGSPPSPPPPPHATSSEAAATAVKKCLFSMGMSPSGDEKHGRSFFESSS